MLLKTGLKVAEMFTSQKRAYLCGNVHTSKSYYHPSAACEGRRACFRSSVRANLSLAFREVTAVTSTAAQSARGVTDRSA